MTQETYNALMVYRECMTTIGQASDRVYIYIPYHDRHTITALVNIARSNGHKVYKRIIAKDTEDAEMYIRIT